MTYDYTYAGLHIQSALRIPEWAGFEHAADSVEANVRICLENGSKDWETPAPDASIIRAGEYCFSVPEVGAYRVLKGREIRVAPDPAAGWREVRLFLLGSAWGALCYQRDLLVLHASAVRVDDEAVAFCAHQGMGKSTMAAWLTNQGYALVSDDLTRFDIPVQGQPTIYPSAPRLKLWHDALNALEWNSEELERDHFRADKFHLSLAEDGRQRPLPLRAIYLLEWGEWCVIRLSGGAAVRRFVSAATYRGALLEPMGKLGAYWRQCLELVRRVPVWELKRPRDLAAMDQTVDALTGHWDSIEQEQL